VLFIRSYDDLTSRDDVKRLTKPFPKKLALLQPLDAPRHRSFVIDTAEQVRVMGVVFRCGAAAAFFRERMDAITNAHVDLDALAAGETEGPKADVA